MMKSNHFKKVENLIQMRGQLRRITGVMEEIEESIRLWKSTDKIDVYWDNFWVHLTWKNDIDLCIALLKADMVLATNLLKAIDSPSFYDQESLKKRVPDFKMETVNLLMSVLKPVKKDIVRLQKVAQENIEEIDRLLRDRWDRWRRRDFRLIPEYVTVVSNELLILEEELMDNWLWLTAGIHRHYAENEHTKPYENENSELLLDMSPNK